MSEQRRIGIVGLGEVGMVVGRELQTAGRGLRAVDARPVSESDDQVAELKIPLSRTADDFGAHVDLCIVTVIGRASLGVATDIVPSLAAGSVYTDWSTTSPGVRDAVAALCAEHGVLYADVSILDTVTWIDRSIQLLLSGPGARALESVLQGTRLIPVVINEERPVSTEVKLMRSVFTKGLEALLLETLSGAEALGIRSDVERSVLRFMQEDFDRIIELLVGSSVLHAERRANEIRDVRDLVVDALGSAPMTAGAIQVLEALIPLATTEDGTRPPADSSWVLEQIGAAGMFSSIGSGAPVEQER